MTVHLFSEAANQKFLPISFYLKLFLNVILKISKLSLQSASSCSRINTISLPPTIFPQHNQSMSMYVPPTSQFTFAPPVAKPSLLIVPRMLPHCPVSLNTSAQTHILSDLTTPFLSLLLLCPCSRPHHRCLSHFLIFSFQKFLSLMQQEKSFTNEI